MWIQIVIAIGVIVAILVLLARWASSGAVAASDAFLDAVKKLDATAAYAMLSPEAQTTITPQEFAPVVQRIGPLLNVPTSPIDQQTNATTEKTTGQVRYVVTATDGQVYDVIIDLEKQGETWKVNNFASTKQ